MNSCSFTDTNAIDFIPKAFEHNTDGLYMDALRFTDGLSESSLRNVSEKSIIPDPEVLQNLVDFEKEAYEAHKKEFMSRVSSSLPEERENLYSTIEEYYYRIAKRYTNMISSIANKKGQIISMPLYDGKELVENCLKDWQFETLPGSNVSKWPYKIKELKENLMNKPNLAFFYEPLPDNYLQSIYLKIKDLAKNMASNQKEEIEIIIEAIQILVLFTLKSGSLIELLKLHDYANEVFLSLEGKLDEEEKSHFKSSAFDFMEKELEKVYSEMTEYCKYHFIRNFGDKGGFKIANYSQFQKQSIHTSSLTTDGTYLYIYVASPNGGMFKIGTGKNSTVPGKVYLYSTSNKIDDICWVYCKEKLYLRSASREIGGLTVISAEDFKVEGTLRLHCPEIFGHPTLQILNKNFPLLTDGCSLYIIGKKLQIERILKEEPTNKKEEITLNPEELAKKREEKKKKEKNKTPAKKEEPIQNNVLKICDFVLYEFDFEKVESEEGEYNFEGIDQNLIQELYESFCYYYNFKECTKALYLNKNDVQNAARWLVDEGQKERKKNTITPCTQTLLAQSEIVSDISNKNLRNNTEIVTKENSVIHSDNVSVCTWTMNKEQICLYTRNGVKIFSKRPEDEKTISSIQDTTVDLRGTLIKTFHWNNCHFFGNECITTYDPYNLRFYTMVWSWNSHTTIFPSSIVVSSDYTAYSAKKVFNNLEKMEKLHQIILEIVRLRYSNPWKLNSWEFTYGVAFNELKGMKTSIINDQTLQDPIKVFSFKKNKLNSKLNKLITGRKFEDFPFMIPVDDKFLYEIKKQFAFSIEGSKEMLFFIISKIANNKNEDNSISIENCQFWLKFLELWSCHSDYLWNFKLSNNEKTTLQNFIETLFSNSLLNHKSNSNLTLKIASKFFPVFFYSLDSMGKLILAIIEKANDNKVSGGLKKLISKIIKVNLKGSGSNSTSMICSYPDKNTKKFLNKLSEFFKIDHFYFKENSSSINPLISSLLITEIPCSKENFEVFYGVNFGIYEKNLSSITLESLFHLHAEYSKKFWESLSKLSLKSRSTASILEFLNHCLTLSLGKCEKMKENKEELEIRRFLISKICKFLMELISGNTQLQNISEETGLSLLNLINSISLLLISKIVPFNEQEIQVFLNFLSEIMQFAKLKNNPLTEGILRLSNEGMDRSSSRTFETNHPYERGRVHCFEQCHFPEAVALAVEIDPKSISDSMADFLILSSWYGTMSTLGFSLNKQIGISPSYKLSGKVTLRRPLIMPGDTIQSEFSPSGQAKDEASLNRWGFKFTIYPIYASEKLLFNGSKEQLDSISREYKSFENMKKWILSVKLFSKSIVHLISSYWNTGNNLKTNDKSLKSILSWAILKNGPMEMSFHQNLPIQIPQRLSDLVDIVEKSDDNPEIIEKLEIPNDIKSILYEFLVSKGELKGIDSSILSSIKVDKPPSEESIEELKKILKDVKSLVPEPTILTNEKRRPTFQLDSKNLWSLCEEFTIFCFLHISGLDKLLKDVNVKITDQLKALGKARNELFSWMLQQVQQQREYSHVLEDILEIYLEQKAKLQAKENPEPKPELKKEVSNSRGKNSKKSKPKEKTESQEPVSKPEISSSVIISSCEKLITTRINSRFEGDQEKIFSLCHLKGITANTELPMESLKVLIEKAKAEVLKILEKGKEKLDSPYTIVANTMLSKLLFLFKMRPMLFGDLSGYEFLVRDDSASLCSEDFSEISDYVDSQPKKLQPPGISRSISHQPHLRQNLMDKPSKFKIWLDSYYKWKLWQIKSNVSGQELQNPNCSPLKSIVTLLTSEVSLESAEKEICLQALICNSRIPGTSLIQQLQSICQNCEFFDGVVSSIPSEAFQYMACVPLEQKQEFLKPFVSIVDSLITSFCKKCKGLNKISIQDIAQRISKIRENESGSDKLELVPYQFFREIYSDLSNIAFLFDSEPMKWNKEKLNQVASEDFLYQVINMGILATTFTILSDNFEDYYKLSQKIIELCQFIIESLLKEKSKKLRRKILSSIIKLLNLEIGRHGEEINLRMLMRVVDLIPQKRISFIVCFLKSFFLHFKPESFTSELQEIAKSLMLIANLNFPPFIINLVVSILKRISEVCSLNSVKSVFSYKYFIFTPKDVDLYKKNIVNKKAIQPELNKKYIELPKNEGNIWTGNLRSLLENIGNKINDCSSSELSTILRNAYTEECKKVFEGKTHENKKKVVLVHLSNEEDITPLLLAYYYWEELYPSFTLKHPKNIQEYIEKKNIKSKKETESKSQNEKAASSIPNQSTYAHRIYERIFLNFPEVNLMSDSESNLPVGWGFTFQSLFTDMFVPRIDFRRGKIKKVVKKVWANSNLTKLEKRYEDLGKSFEEFKDEDTEEVKMQIVKAKNFISRMSHHLKEVHTVASMLNVFGFAPILDCLPCEKADELADLVRLAIERKLKPIDLSGFSEEIKKKIDPIVIISTPSGNLPTNKKSVDGSKIQPPPPPPIISALSPSNMIVSITNIFIFQSLDFHFDFVTSLNQTKDYFYSDCNKFSVAATSVISGTSRNIQLYNLCELVQSFALKDKNAVEQIVRFFETKDYSTLSNAEKSVLNGLLAVIGNFGILPTPSSTFIKNSENGSKKFSLLTGGNSFGKLKYTGLSLDDHSLTVQTFCPSDIEMISYQNQLKSLFGSSQILRLLKDNLKVSQPSNQDLLFRRLLLLVLIENEIESIEEYQEVASLLTEQTKKCPLDRNFDHYQSQFLESWERVSDSRNKDLEFYTQPQNKVDSEKYKSYTFDRESENKEEEKKEEIKKAENTEAFRNVLPPSRYLSSLPQYQPVIDEHKMLQHWEKHLIPKIQDFVRSSLKPFEFDDFFEQIRGPLRKGDQARAAEVAYIICDQRLPSGVSLPDANHDWTTLSIEEVYVGQWCTIKICDASDRIFSPLFRDLKRAGVKDVLGMIYAIEQKSNSVLVMFHDHVNCMLSTFWVPINSLKIPEISIKKPANWYNSSTVIQEFNSLLEISNSLLARKFLLKLLDFQLPNISSFNLHDTIKWTILEEINSEPLTGWLFSDSSDIKEVKKGLRLSVSKNPKLSTAPFLISPSERSIVRLEKLKSVISNSIESIESSINWLQVLFNDVSLQLSKYVNKINLQHDSKLMLHSFGDDSQSQSLSSLILEFDENAKLCTCSGLKFYSEENSNCLIKQISAGKDERGNIEPVVFNLSKIWSQYIFDSQALPPYLQNSISSYLPATVYGIPSEFSISCWLVEALSDSVLKYFESSSNKKDDFSAGLNSLARIIAIIMECLKKLKGPVILREIIIRLLTRTIKKISYIYNSICFNEERDLNDKTKLFGVDINVIRTIYEEIQGLVQEANSKKKPYSSYLQELIELYSTFCTSLIDNRTDDIKHMLSDNLNLEIPDYIEHFIKLQVVSMYICGENKLPNSMKKEIESNMKINSHSKYLLIQNFHHLWDECKIKQVIVSAAKMNYAKIYDPISDIIVKGNEALVLIESFSKLDIKDLLNEEERLKSVSEEPKEKKTPEFWICAACTLENAWSIQICDVCESPKPPMQDDEPEVKQSNMYLLQDYIKDRGQKNMESFVNLIKSEISKANEEYVKSCESKKLELKVEEEKSQPQEPVEKKKIDGKKLAIKEEKEKLKEEKRLKYLEKTLRKKAKRKGKEFSGLDQLPQEQKKEEEEEVKQSFVAKEEPVSKEEETKKIEVKEPIVLEGLTEIKNSQSVSMLIQHIRTKLLKGNELNTHAQSSLKDFYNENSEMLKCNGINGIPFNDFDEFKAFLCNSEDEEILTLWEFFSSHGIDFWLNLVNFKEDLPSLRVLQTLLKAVETEICKETPLALVYCSDLIKLPVEYDNKHKPINFDAELSVINQFPKLANIDIRVIRYGYSVVQYFNKILAESINLVNIHSEKSSYEGLWLSQSCYMGALSSLIMMPVKNETLQIVMKMTTIAREITPKITLERLSMEKQSHSIDLLEGISTKDKEKFIFTKAHDQLKEVEYTSLRPKQPTGSDPFIAFEVIFRGELVMGEAGPYRQFFADVSAELQPHAGLSSGDLSKSVGLLIPSPNNEAKIGSGRNKFIINPSCTSAYHMDLYHTLGLLMGCSIRTGTHLTLDLPSLLWKQILDKPITLEDIEEVDKHLCDFVKFIKECSKEEFEETLFETFSTTLSNKKKVDLIPNGSSIKVEYEGRFDYLTLLFESRLNESKKQVEAIRLGILKIIPQPLFHIISASDLEIWTCGKSVVDFDLLKRHTIYSGGFSEESETIKNFWSVLNSLQENEKLMFVKFCWGQERLPANDKEFEKIQTTRFMIKMMTSHSGSVDDPLPKADTCFFNLELPNYSNFEIMREKILIAITTDCDSMNAEELINLDPNASGDRRNYSYDEEEE